MKYNSIGELPEDIQKKGTELATKFMNVFNIASENYGDDGEALRVAKFSILTSLSVQESIDDSFKLNGVFDEVRVEEQEGDDYLIHASLGSINSYNKENLALKNKRVFYIPEDVIRAGMSDPENQTTPVHDSHNTLSNRSLVGKTQFMQVTDSGKWEFVLKGWDSSIKKNIQEGFKLGYSIHPKSGLFDSNGYTEKFFEIEKLGGESKRLCMKITKLKMHHIAVMFPSVEMPQIKDTETINTQLHSHTELTAPVTESATTLNDSGTMTGTDAGEVDKSSVDAGVNEKEAIELPEDNLELKAQLDNQNLEIVALKAKLTMKNTLDGLSVDSGIHALKLSAIGVTSEENMTALNELITEKTAAIQSDLDRVTAERDEFETTVKATALSQTPTDPQAIDDADDGKGKTDERTLLGLPIAGHENLKLYKGITYDDALCQVSGVPKGSDVTQLKENHNDKGWE